jgi:hypothetical protein
MRAATIQKDEHVARERIAIHLAADQAR